MEMLKRPSISFWLAGICLLQLTLLLRYKLQNETHTGYGTTYRVLVEHLRENHKQSEPYLSQQPLRSWNELPTGSDGEIIDSLSDAQCDLAFPDLYTNIDRASQYWQDRNHTISPQDIEVSSWRQDSAVRLLIHDNQLRVLQGLKVFGSGGRSRCIQAMFIIYRALESATAAGEKVPDIEFSIVVPDVVEMPNATHDTHTIWHWNRQIGNEDDERHWLMPNFDFWRGQGPWTYRQSRTLAKARDAPFKSKIPKIVWRGTKWVNPVIRGKLLDVSKGKDWADVEDVSGGHETEYMDNHDLCKYAMTVHTEGISYSGRLKWLAECDSLIFVHDLSWDLFYYHLLVPSGPMQNYVSVKNDWSDLEEKVTYYLEHPDEAEKIIANSIATFRERYLTRAAVSCYTRKLIHGYAGVSSTPEIRSKEQNLLRGHPFEALINDPRDLGDETT